MVDQPTGSTSLLDANSLTCWRGIRAMPPKGSRLVEASRRRSENDPTLGARSVRDAELAVKQQNARGAVLWPPRIGVSRSAVRSSRGQAGLEVSSTGDSFGAQHRAPTLL